MSTLKKEDFEIMKTQIKNAKNKLISKEDVLSIIHHKLKVIDETNKLIVDRIDGIAVKDLLNDINKIKTK